MEQLSAAWPVLLTAGGILLLALAAIFTVRFFRSRSRRSEMDDMEGHEFEYFCADLLKDNGFTEVEVTRGSGDYGVDVFAVKGKEKLAIQAKMYGSSSRMVNRQAMMELYGAAAYFDCTGAVLDLASNKL